MDDLWGRRFWIKPRKRVRMIVLRIRKRQDRGFMLTIIFAEIDGRLPGDAGKDNQPEQPQKTQLGQNTVAVEATEGLNQSDYLRRLARQMKQDDARWQQEDRSGIRAIGL